MSIVPACALANSWVTTDTAVAAHPVGDREQVAVGPGLLPRSGNERSHRVFIVGANLAEIACLAELNFQHGRRRLKHFPLCLRENAS